MKKIDRGNAKYFIMIAVATAVCGIIIYPILDLIVCKFITNSEFEYSVLDHVIEPVLFGFVFGVSFWVGTKVSKKLDKKKKWEED